MDNLELLTASRTQVTERRKKTNITKMNKIMSSTDPTNEIGGGVNPGAHEL